MTAERAPIAAVSGGAQLAQATRRFDIPAQALADALTLFGQQSGLQVTLDAALAAGLSTRGVSGTMTSREALAQLLSGTGLTWRFVGSNTVALEKPAADESGIVTLAPLTVTAERVDRSVRDTATSVVVFDSAALEQRPHIDSSNDVLERIPNVTTAGTSNLAPAVRGVDGTGPAQGADAFLAGTRPRLNVQVDGRPLSYNEVVFGDAALWDVEQVEVLRGAQSQLQGRNAIAGTVIVKTKDPTYEPEVGGRFAVGNRETTQLAAFVSGPVVEDQVALRFAANRSSSHSFLDMGELSNGDDPGEYISNSLRGKMLIEPRTLEGFSTMVTLNYTDYRAPQWEGAARPFDDHVGAFLPLPYFNPRSAGGIVETTWELSDGLTVENTFSATDIRVERHAEPGAGNVEIDALEFAEEPRLRFSALDGKLTGLGGIYVFRNTQDETIDSFGNSAFEDETTTGALFGEATYGVLDDLDITLGGRIEREHRQRSGFAGPFVIDFDETYTAFLPKAGIAWHATDELTVGAVASRGYNGGGAGFTYNPPFESYTFEPEYVWTYEAYGRAELFDRRLNLTGNIFFSDYTDMQLPFDLNPDPDVWSVVVRNADRAITYGAELGARWLALPGLELFGEIGLLETEVTDYPGSGVEGHELALAPAFTAEFGAVYQHESGFDVSADARFSDAYFSSIENNPRGRTESYFVVNAQAGYRFETEVGSWRVFAFVENLFDADDAVLLQPGATAVDDTAILLRPRLFGVGLEAKF